MSFSQAHSLETERVVGVNSALFKKLSVVLLLSYVLVNVFWKAHLIALDQSSHMVSDTLGQGRDGTTLGAVASLKHRDYPAVTELVGYLN